MRYAQHRSTVRRPRRSHRRGPFLFLSFLLIAGAFGGWMWRKNSADLPVAAEASDVTTQAPATDTTESPTNDVAAPVVESALAAVIPGSASAHEAVQNDISLTYLETGSGFSAHASRFTADGQYTIKVVAIPPAIDDLRMTYEAWLVTPGITDYFSIGNLARREDGKWQAVWTQDVARVRPDMDQFTTVVITREMRDGNMLPSPQHVFEGMFQ